MSEVGMIKQMVTAMIEAFEVAANRDGYFYVQDERTGIVTLDIQFDPNEIMLTILKAMRNPTNAMLEAGATYDGTSGHIGKGDAALIWRSMLDDALKEHEDKG